MKRKPSDIRTPRPDVEWFAEEMEQQLRRNDYKHHWSGFHNHLINRMAVKSRALKRAWNAKKPQTDKIVRLAADVANYAMMIASNAVNKESPF